ncbi:hypothetical protein PFISCL1PPCAC_18260 [Pristionchus fissidentatus]|uniref:aralkylamine N-acetyltransferase n=1 Tax=Pristionchus fissidentatus TaxID=1538716 RepID=A0AAV5W8A6_9BILA|nr:hypothetical protein PFISCL1PPCAC_18260 [Pristionchus fissidentatus]
MDSITTSFAAEADREAILHFMLGDFLENESLNGALDLKKEESRSLFIYLIQKGVKSGTSLLLKNGQGSIIGLRLSSFLDRPNGEEKEEEENDENLEFDHKAVLIDGLLQKLEDGRWDRIPSEVNRLFYVIVISVQSHYTRRGLGKVLLEYGMDKVREAGATAILSEATAMKSQALFAKHGYSILNEIRHEDHVDKEGKRIFNCPDGTNSAQLVFKYINNESN